ncbi:hypothetical protein [Ammoniphilus sp. CFH 90114]|uniref:hypothetical protein n=1 Tax=Ammoniphilus sp. CFH 90114 TaxID=2493665 RepID=UPI0013E96FA2|nr:hypothetical protein [Ammoniphilus sp. CFH 90114]
MSIILTESRCKDCQTKLSYYEITEKEGLCIPCYKDQQTPVVHTRFVLPRKKTKRSKAI